MKAVILLATAAIALPFLISGLTSDHRAVADRFLERAFPGPPTLPTNDAQRPEIVDANKLRQAGITTEIMEIVGGAEALRQAESAGKPDLFREMVSVEDITPAHEQ